MRYDGAMNPETPDSLKSTRTCRVTYADGAHCGKDVYSDNLCNACRTWSNRHNGADPEGRKPVHKLTPEQVIERIRRLPVDHNGCRMGDEIYGTDKDGYPFLKSGGVMWRAARFVLTHKIGRPIREGMHACHTCDQPACLSEEHLWEGTCAENRNDSASKGRTMKGYGHPRPLRRLEEWQVRDIRDRAARRTDTQVALAAEYRVSVKHVQKIVSRQSWAWLD